MKSTNADRMNLPIRQSLPAKSCGDAMNFRARCKLLSKPYWVTHYKGSVWSWCIPFQNYFSPQRMGAITMIAISILCALLICLFRFDLDDAASPR
jgi:hypothetical protein